MAKNTYDVWWKIVQQVCFSVEADNVEEAKKLSRLGEGTCRVMGERWYFNKDNVVFCTKEGDDGEGKTE